MNHVVEPQLLSVELAEDKCIISMQLPSDLLYFKGHFTESAVLPGVVQLDWAVKMAKKYFNYPTSAYAKKLEVLKFQHIVVPEQHVTLTLSRKSQTKFSFQYEGEGIRHSSGRVVLEVGL